MSGSVLRRLILLLTAFGFVLATLLPSAMSASAMPMEKACAGCAEKAPAANNLGKLPCAALSCAGIAIALPARQAPYIPVAAALAYLPGPAADIVGVSPLPDPHPPRPPVLG